MRTIELKVYGTRGSCATGSREYVEFGGDTSSYTIKHGRVLHFLDAGSGIRRAMAEQMTSEIERVFLNITHGHADHIDMGCAAGIYQNQLREKIRIFGYEHINRALKNFFDGDTIWPVPLDGMKGFSPELKACKGGEMFSHVNDGDPFVVTTLRNYHPPLGDGGSVGFRFDMKKPDKKVVSVAYVTDMEFDYKPGMKTQEESERLKYDFKRFVKGADLLLADTQFTKKEYFETMPFVRGFGHPYMEQIIELSAEAEVKDVLGVHHAPQHTDEIMRKIEREGKEYARSFGLKGEFAMARDGLSVKL